MKKLNLIKGLWDDSHEKQTPQMFARYAVMLLMLLTLGVGQMWATGYNDETHVYLKVNGTTKYYKVSTESWSCSATLPGTWGGVLSSQTFNNVHNIQVVGGGVGGWTSYGDALTGSLSYKVTQSTSTPSTWTSFGSIDGSSAYNGDNCFYYKNNGSTNVTPTTPGTYYLHIKITYNGSTSKTSYVKIVVPTFTVAGSSAVLGSNWSATDTGNDMTFSTGTTYSLTKSNVTLATGTTYECKVVVDHSFSEAYPATNKQFTVDADGHYNVTFTFDASSHAVNVSTTRLYAITPQAKYTTSPNGASYTTGTTGGTVTINSSSSATYVAEGSTYTISATPEAGYIVESVNVGSTNIYSNTSRTSGAYNNSSQTASADADVTVKFARVKNITVYIYTGTENSVDVTTSSVVMNGCVQYVGATSLTSMTVNNHTAGSPKFTLSGNWLSYTFTNVSQVSNITCARSGANVFTGTITDNVYYMYDGTALSSQCVPRSNPTWGTAPANGAAGGTMTASVSGAPDGATISWSSTATSYATVNSSGVISYVAAGNATIKARVQKAASGDYCALDYTLSQDITVTSGATVSATRTCPEYVPSGVAGQVSMHITFTGTSSGWKYRIKQVWNSGYATNWEDASGSSADWTKEGGIDAETRSFVVELYDHEYASTPVATSSPVSVTGENTQTVNIAAGTNGSVSPSGEIRANNNHVHPTITATPNEHYHFVNWTSSNAAASVADANNATTTVTATAPGYTITANFAGDQYSITYKDQGGGAFSGTQSTPPTTHTYGTATTLKIPTKDGYTFGGWFTASDCASGAVGNTTSASLGATAYTANITLYAKWTENTVTLTPSVSYDHGSSNYTASASNSGTVGVTTTTNLSCSAPNAAHYTFAGWTLSSNLVVTSGNAATDRNITVRTNGDGNAVSATANYNEVLTTSWKISGDAPAATAGSPFTGWGASGTSMQKKSGYSTVEKYYCTFNVTTLATTDAHFPFQVYDGTNHRGYDGFWITKENNSTTVYTGNPTNMKFRPYIAGTYEFEVDNTGANPVLTVHWPVINQLRISAASPADATNVNNFDLADKGGNDWQVKRTLNANTTYTFKMVYDGAWYGDGHAFTRASNTTTGLGDGDNMTLKTDVAGEYTFTFNSSSKNLEITYPAAYTVTYGVGTSYTSMGSVSTSPSITSGNYVIAGTEVAFTATPNLGYKFVGWYREAACTNLVSASNPYEPTINATTTLYAKFELLTLYMNSDINSWGSAIYLTHTAQNAAVYTYTGTLNANPTNDAPAYTSGWHFEYCYNTARSEKAYQYTSVQTPTYSGSSIDGVHTYSPTNTIQFGLTRKSDVTITLTLQTAPTMPTLNIAADPYYTITYGVPTHGSYTIKVGSAAAVGASTESTAGKTITLAPSASTGYHFDSWTVTKAGGGTVTVISNQFTMPSDDVTIAATFLPTSYDVTLKPNGATTGSDQVVRATYDAAMPTTTKTSAALAAPTKTGYTLQGFYQNSDGTGTKYYNANMTSANSWDQAGNANVWAKWQANPYTVTLDVDETNQGNIEGATTSQNVTFDGATTTVPNRPTAAQGYALVGYYTGQLGAGTKVINGDGTWIASVEGYTDGSKRWIHPDNVTLYAYYQQAEITNIAFSPGTVVENNSTVTVTATISPTPTGTTTICWRVLYDNGSALDPQPTFDPEEAQGNSVSFTAPEASGMYKVEAKLRTGSACDGGTLLDTHEEDFQVAGSHTVTVDYKYSGTKIAASSSVTGRPLDWSEEAITAPDIFGYTFSSWSAGDGITIKDSEHEDVTSSTEASIKIKATYNGTLTANYTPKSLIYFKNTLGWSSVYVNFYGEDGYWDDKGSGNKSVTNRNKAMTRIGETDVWYYDYGAASIMPTKWVAFTQDSQNGDGSGAQNFWASGTGEPVSYPARRADDLADKAGETGFYAATPMFVPLAGQTPITKNESGGGKALYYNSGYWTKYLPGTGYTLEIYNAAGNSKLKEMDFTSADELMPMKAVADLEANTTYKFQIKRHGDVYLGNSGTMTYANHGQSTPWEMTNSGFSMCGITTTAAGDYTFNFTYSANASNQYRLRLSVDYPVGNGDYRLVYTDGTRSGRLKPSAIVQKENDGSAIVSFFVRHNQTPVLRIQQATVDGAGNITWNEYPTSGTPTNQITGAIASAITKDTVYNFNLSMNGSGALSVAGVEYYSGNYYIRTDAANSKWDNYRTDPDHLMTYSEYLKKDLGYSHYYTHWVRYTDTGRKNVKFVIANDYSPCISDTLAREAKEGMWAHIDDWMEEGGDLKRSANVRFMWDIKTNAIARAYVDGSQEDGSEFLLMLNPDSPNKIRWSAESALTSDKVTFSDNGNWIYEANIQAQPNAQIKLKSTWGNTGNAIVQYFKGSSSETETLVGGSGETWYPIRIIYDFKTNRLVASYVPSTGTISTDIPINADVMFIREHQGDIAQLTFSGSGAISKITTAYGVMRFNKWTINNKAKAEPHSPLAPELTRYERDLFYISFPFRVNLEEVFGFGTYGTHWIIEEYDGAARAAKGFWADTETFWRFITNRKGKFLEPNVGYLLALDLDMLGEGSDVWANTEQVELYFPSYGKMPTITSSSVTYNVPAHACTINRGTAQGDRRIKDSHWNVISVPTYINTNNVTFANTDWITEGDGKLGPSFLYTVNWNDNSLSATSGVGYTYKAMHAYIVQYKDNITWTTSVSPATAPRRNPEAPKDVEYRLELLQNEQTIDQTFVRLSNEEEVSVGFAFGEDLSKEFNKNKANIYTMVTTIMEDGPSVTQTAGNVLPMSEQTTVVPVGVKIASAGDYTFAIPEGTNGVGVTLIDNETGIRTSLSALDYTISLPAGTYDNRFVLEISPIVQSPTGIESTEQRTQNTDVRKVLIDNILYIVKDGVMYDARGARVQ